MTDVLFEWVGGPKRIGVRPHARHTDGTKVHLPAEETYTLPTGATLDLEVSTPGRCMRIRELSTGGVTRHVLIPASETPVPYSELVDVDPDSFDPIAEPVAAWVAELEQLAARVQVIEDQGPGNGGGPGPVPVPFAQPDPSSIWSIAHGLGYRPGGVLVLDTDGNEHRPVVAFPTASTVTLTFGYAVAGIAYLS